MFTIFRKKKPKLSRIIPNGFVDIHSHILPGIDDGAKNVNESIDLIEKMKEMGFSKVIGTPHCYPGLYNNTNATIKKSFSELHEKVKDSIIMSYACEYMIDDSLIKKAENKNLLVLKENYVLVEMSFLSAPINLYDIIFSLTINDYIPVLAHPERYLFFSKKLNDFEKLKIMGCKFQLNLLSTIGYYGKNVTQLSNSLLNGNFIDFVGSDIHTKHQLKLFENKLQIDNIDEINYAIKRNSLFND